MTLSSQIWTIFKKKANIKLSQGKLVIDGKGHSRVTVYHRGGGQKRVFRHIDFLNYVWNVYGTVLSIEYDPNRTALLHLIMYANGIMCYRLAVERIYVGMRIMTKLSKKLYIGWSSYLKFIKTGVFVSLIELYRASGALYCRAMGSYAKLLTKKLKNKIILSLRKSKRMLYLAPERVASIGTVLRKFWKTKKFKKAGNVRLIGWRPRVRGVAMNPVDHPHGGRTKSCLPVTPWGKLTKGVPTRRNKSKFEKYLKR